MTLDIPDRSASAEDVRRFIADVLVSDYDTDRDFAGETARAWQIGRGAELHDARLKYFEDVFGAEIGFCLYKSILEARDKEWQSSHIGILFKCKLPLSFANGRSKSRPHRIQGASFCHLSWPFGLCLGHGQRFQTLVRKLLCSPNVGRALNSLTASVPLLLHGALLTSYAYLRPKHIYISLAMGLLSFGVYFAVLLFR